MIYRFINPTMARNQLFACIALFILSTGHCRKHVLNLQNDMRNCFPISTFGFWEGGKLQVKLHHLSFYSNFNPLLGFTITKAESTDFFLHTETQQNSCFINDVLATGNIPITTFLLDFQNDELLVRCSNLLPDVEMESITLTVNDNFVKLTRDSFIMKQEQSVNTVQNKDDDFENEEKESTVFDEVSDSSKADLKTDDVASMFVSYERCSSSKIPFKSQSIGLRTKISDLQFIMSLNGIEDVGMYGLYFHNCPTANVEAEPPKATPVNMSIHITENNGENYLSVSEMALPKLYFLMSIAFFIIGCAWIAVLQKKREETFKIHYLMSVIVFLKSLSLLFHGIVYHNIAKSGYPAESWIILYYTTQSLKNALLFVTIILISAGWSLIQNVLSLKNKIVITIVVLLQIVANVANIAIQENDGEGESCYISKEIFMSVDLICCGFILFPSVWSVTHLRKTVVNLGKVKLFKCFFVEIVFYVFFSRIIAFIIKINVPFQYEWFAEVCHESATFIFFITTGITFRPTPSNPYFDLCKSMDSTLVPIGLIQAGLKGNLSKIVESHEVSKETGKGIPSKGKQPEI